MYANSEKLQTQYLRNQELEEEYKQSTTYKWYLAIRQLLIEHNNWKEFVRVDGKRYNYLGSRTEPSEELKNVLIPKMIEKGIAIPR